LVLFVATNLLAATSQRRYAIKPGAKPGEEPAVLPGAGKQLGLFERVDGRFARYGRKIVKKLVERLSAFDVFQQRLKWNPRPAENRRAAQDLGITRDDAV
jgi:hypothetical protein